MSNRDCVSLVNVTDNLPSTDHLAIEFSMSILIPTQFHGQRTLYKPISMFFCEGLSHIPWNVVSDDRTLGVLGRICFSPL